jgi:hypothetical protein
MRWASARVAVAVDAGDMMPVAPVALRSNRRISTASRYDMMGEAQQQLAFAFRSFPSPRRLQAVAASIVCCVMLQLTVAAPYAANERAADRGVCGVTRHWHMAQRGLIVGVASEFFIAAIFLIGNPILVSGEFRRRFLLSLPVPLAFGSCAAFIPIFGSTLGYMAILISTVAASYMLCFLCLSVPLHATDEHRALEQSIGPPLVTITFAYFGLIALYVYLTRNFPSVLNGFFLPVATVATLHVALSLLSWSCDRKYHQPKATFLAKFEATSVPPTLYSGAPVATPSGSSGAPPPTFGPGAEAGAPAHFIIVASHESVDESSAQVVLPVLRQ